MREFTWYAPSFSFSPDAILKRSNLLIHAGHELGSKSNDPGGVIVNMWSILCAFSLPLAVIALADSLFFLLYRSRVFTLHPIKLLRLLVCRGLSVSDTMYCSSITLYSRTQLSGCKQVTLYCSSSRNHSTLQLFSAPLWP